ncbi:MAG: hypothetical protein JAY84_20385 [Candidatus Thiodiazotropha taylori]|nr:hypothetical protein [Candidatus Thiodiazotropha taylori]
MATQNKRQRPDSNDDDEHIATTIFTSQESFARFLIIKSKDEDKPITSLSPFVIEKQIEASIGTAKSVKKLKNETLLVETTRKTQTESLKKMTSFFAIPVEVTEHSSLNSSKGIIRDPNLRKETEENILNYLKPQGVTHVKRFKIKKNGEYIQTNTLLLTFNTVVAPKSLKIFYQIIPVELYVPNPLRCFNCQKFGHHENNCPVIPGSVCEKCGTGGDDHRTSQCKNPAKCVNCGGNHVSRSSDCEVWKKEKEIMKVKVTQRLTYPEARKIYEQQKPEFSFSKIVQSAAAKPETKSASTQFNEKDFKITESSKVIIARNCRQKTSSTSLHAQNSQSLTLPKPSSEKTPIDKKQNQQNTKPKPLIASSRLQKGSDDPIMNYNKFGVLDDGAMDTEEGGGRQGARGSRPRSPVTAPK